MEYDILGEVLVLLASAVVILTLFRRLNLPFVLGYLVVGLVAGPSGIGYVPTEDQPLLAELGVVFLLFTLGLEFSIARVSAMKWEVFGLGGLQVVITTVLFAVYAWSTGMGPGVAVVIGGALALSSTALVLKQLSDQLELNRTHGRMATGILLFQDIAAVPLLVLIPLLADTEREYRALDVSLALGEGALVVVIVLLVGRWLLRPLFHEIGHGHSPELFTLAILLVALGAAWATHAVGLSLALGAFLAGMMLSETEYRHQVEADVRPIRDIFLGLFFVTVGMRLDVSLLFQEVATIALLVFALIVLKTILTAVLARAFSGIWRNAVRTALSVAQGGEFGLALISLAASSNVLPPEVAQPVLAAIILSMLLSPFVIRANADLTAWLQTEDQQLLSELENELEGTKAIAERDHVVICGFGRVGQNIARLLEEEGFEYLALDLDPTRVRRARLAGDSVYYGNAAMPGILERAGIQHASVVVISFSDPLYANRIVQTARKFRPDVPILVRTRDDAYFDLLEKSGATSIVPEAMESSLLLAAEVLNLLDVPLTRIIRKVESVRDHRYRELRSLFPKEAARQIDSTHTLREQLGTVVLPPGAYAVGRTLGAIALADADVTVTAIRRRGITGRQPDAKTEFLEGDVVVLYGTPEALEHAETMLLSG